jgi:hypothetical protein
MNRSKRIENHDLLYIASYDLGFGLGDAETTWSESVPQPLPSHKSL